MKANRLLTLILLFGVSTICNGQSFGIGTDIPDPSAVLEVAGNDRGILIPRISIADATSPAPVTSPATSLLVYNTNSSIANGKGEGYYYWTGSIWQPLLDYPIVKNGLSFISLSDGIKLGGTLTENTLVTLDDYDFTFDLDQNGELIISENGDTKFIVHNDGKVSIADTDAEGDFNVNGTSYFSDDITLRRNDVSSGDDLVKLTSQSNNGVIEIYENNDLNHKIHGRNESVFNETGLSTADFRVETENRTDAFVVDAGDDVVRVGNPANSSLTDNGNSVYDQFGIEQGKIDYVLHADNTETTGTTIGLGSKEYLVDGNSETLFSDVLSPTTHLTVDLGWSNAWRTVNAMSFAMTSDKRAKSNIKPIDYGLKEILNMRPVSYTLNQDPFKEVQLGLIAQETLPLVPEVVQTFEFKKITEGGEYVKQEMPLMRMTYIELIPVLIKAIQEQNTQIENEKAKFEALEREVKELKQMNQEILEKLDSLISE